MEADRRDVHILIVGGGGTGGALAHDLSLRGLRVTLVGPDAMADEIFAELRSMVGFD